MTTKYFLILLLFFNTSAANELLSIDKNPLTIPACEKNVDECRRAGVSDYDLRLKCIGPISLGKKNKMITVSAQQAMICSDAWIAINNDRYFFYKINFRKK